MDVCCRHIINWKFNILHERCLRIFYQGKQSLFEKTILFHGTESVSVLGPKIEKLYQIVLKRLLIPVLLKRQLKHGNQVIALTHFVGWGIFSKHCFSLISLEL